MKRYKYLLFFIFVLCFSHCDLDKFTGYDHDAPPLPTSARIYGKLTNIFTAEPVNLAVIRIGEQATYSDENGEFEFFYFLAEDDARNKPNQLLISARNYATIDTMMVIFPENEIEKKLVYAAPIIKKIALIGPVCQAEVFDYQGYQDISSVYGSFYYTRPGERMWALNTTQALTRITSDSVNTAYFQAMIPEEIAGFGNLIQSFKIFARDRAAHSDSTNNSITGVDTLFIPIFH
jgi:hypothetical protein